MVRAFWYSELHHVGLVAVTSTQDHIEMRERLL